MFSIVQSAMDAWSALLLKFKRALQSGRDAEFSLTAFFAPVRHLAILYSSVTALCLPTMLGPGQQTGTRQRKGRVTGLKNLPLSGTGFPSDLARSSCRAFESATTQPWGRVRWSPEMSAHTAWL